MMKPANYIFLLALLVSACALVDGYKDNQHSAWAKSLPADLRTRIDNGEQIELELDEHGQSGKVIVLKGDSKYGKYNFVEVGPWDETFEFQSNSFKRVKARVKTRYDGFGNTRSRTVDTKYDKDPDFYTTYSVSSRFEVFRGDSVLTQEIKMLDNQGNVVTQHETATLDYRQMLSDRLKKKIRIGRWVEYKDGVLKKEKLYRYEDRIPE